MANTITPEDAASSLAECVCKPGWYANSSSSSFRCERCIDLHEQPRLDATDCLQPGVTLDKIRVQPGFWRQRPSAQYVRACDLPEACLGGESASQQQCSEGHHGPLCDLCVTNGSVVYHGGRGKQCELCEGNMGLTIALQLTVVLLAAVTIAFAVCRRKRSVVAKISRVLDNASRSSKLFDLEDPNASIRLSGVTQLLKHNATEEVQTSVSKAYDKASIKFNKSAGQPSPSPRHTSSSRSPQSPPPSPPSSSSPPEPRRSIASKMKQHCVSIVNLCFKFGVKLRILISLVQVGGQLSGVFDITYPPFFLEVLEALSSINLNIGTLPFACIYPWASSFYFDLLCNTLIPLGVVVGLMTVARLLRQVEKVRKRRSTTSSTASSTANISSSSSTTSASSSEEVEFSLFMANVCDDIWFFVIFLTYPSTCSTVFKTFMAETFDADGEEKMTLLRADRSIDMTSPTFTIFYVYAWVMVGVFPIGVPLFYASLLFRSRHELRELRLIEVTQETDHQLALMQAAAQPTAEARAAAESKADELFDAASARYQHLRSELPTTLRKLTAGYELRTFWFEVRQSRRLAFIACTYPSNIDTISGPHECPAFSRQIFECGRKILLSGVPVFLPGGSPGQFIFGISVCFVTFGVYCSYAPYIDRGDDILSAVCQASIFFSLAASAVTNLLPDDPSMTVLLPMMLAVPVCLALFFESPLMDLIHEAISLREDGTLSSTGRLWRAVSEASLEMLDWALSTAQSSSSGRSREIELELKRAGSSRRRGSIDGRPTLKRDATSGQLSPVPPRPVLKRNMTTGQLPSKPRRPSLTDRWMLKRPSKSDPRPPQSRRSSFADRWKLTRPSTTEPLSRRQSTDIGPPAPQPKEESSEIMPSLTVDRTPLNSSEELERALELETERELDRMRRARTMNIEARTATTLRPLEHTRATEAQPAEIAPHVSSSDSMAELNMPTQPETSQVPVRSDTDENSLPRALEHSPDAEDVSADQIGHHEDTDTEDGTLSATVIEEVVATVIEEVVSSQAREPLAAELAAVDAMAIAARRIKARKVAAELVAKKVAQASVQEEQQNALEKAALRESSALAAKPHEEERELAARAAAVKAAAASEVPAVKLAREELSAHASMETASIHTVEAASPEVREFVFPFGPPLGAVLGDIGTEVVVYQVDSGSAASLRGLPCDSVVLFVNGKSTESLNSGQTVELIRAVAPPVRLRVRIPQPARSSAPSLAVSREDLHVSYSSHYMTRSSGQSAIHQPPPCESRRHSTVGRTIVRRGQTTKQFMDDSKKAEELGLST